MLEQVSVTTVGYGIEEVAANHHASVSDAGRCQRGLRSGYNIRLVETNATHGGMSLQNPGQQCSCPAAHIHDATE